MNPEEKEALKEEILKELRFDISELKQKVSNLSFYYRKTLSSFEQLLLENIETITNDFNYIKANYNKNWLNCLRRK
ncbi:MAG: hypothetical protein RLY15_1245 [Bacteroidota bacterium]